MGKMKELYISEQHMLSGSGDEDYLYEQYLTNEKLNEEYWESLSKQSPITDIQFSNEYLKSTYIPTIEEQLELNELLNKQNGHT